MDQPADFIHKESSKENLNAKGLKPLAQTLQAKGLKEGSTRQSQQQMSNEQRTKGEHESNYRLAKMRANAEIDAFLHKLLMEDVINQEYWNFHAKAVHTLGIHFCNRLAINARNGANSQRLYAYKIKGALQAHYKSEYEQGSIPE